MSLFLSLLPALIMITLVIFTRKVLLSLSVGIILAALIISDWQIIDTFRYLIDDFYSIVTSFDWYLPILGFVIFIGAITSVLTLIGSVSAFASWSVSKVKNPVAAQILTWMLGLIICIDDYLNTLVIGEVSKPVTDEYKVSRAKLAYIIDSTSAPVVILMPISTWGAYIISEIASNFSSEGFNDYSGFSGFVKSVPYQFYPIITIFMVLLIIYFKINFGPMKKFEEHAEQGDDITKIKVTEVVDEKDIKTKKATHWSLIVTVVILIVSTLFTMLINAGFKFSQLFDQDITIPLFIGGLTSFITALIYAFMYKEVKPKKILETAGLGMLGMIRSAVAILILAWMVGNAIKGLETGDKIAEVVLNVNFMNALLPVVMFLIAGGIAFSTGTSWGAFAILLPIAIPIAAQSAPHFMPVMIAAVLGGAVFGDHASPVSDTTVLSATGAQSTLHAHFISQLPYALISALLASLSYVLYGITESLIITYLFMALSLAGFVYVYKLLKQKST
ncbi:MAG: Na+/H+ antiporter NhaC family protein [Bacillota bacterium]|nr:MAG: Na+/H+ antiporter NhaC family protein [Bacillota bacterium]